MRQSIKLMGAELLGCEPGQVEVPDPDTDTSPFDTRTTSSRSTYMMGRALREAVADGFDVVLTSGGTGVTPTDRTPEATRDLLDFEIPGIAEAIRAGGAAAGVPAAVLSRGIAGLAGAVLVVNLPGSTGGVRDGMAVLGPILGHAVDQARGGDHPRPGGPPGS